MSRTAIEYVRNPDGSEGRTWEWARGCTKVSPGCLNCFAERLALTRLQRHYPNGFSHVEVLPDHLEDPLHWLTPQVVFVNSRSDTFHRAIPDDSIRTAFRTMEKAKQHTFLVLTKRPERMVHWSDDNWGAWPGNVKAGISAENQEWLDLRAGWLVLTPAAWRFISLEPLLGPVSLGRWFRLPAHPINGVIVGGESGPNFRPMEISWLERVVADCRAADVPCFVKQDAGRCPGRQGRIPDDLWQIKEYPFGERREL